jgi:putative redox protein
MGHRSEALKKRTKPFALRNRPFDPLSAASCREQDHRAPGGARSRREFLSKLSVVIEEADESALWLEVLVGAGLVSEIKLKDLQSEAKQVVAIFDASRTTTAKKESSINNQQPAINNSSRENTMTQASATWKEKQIFNGIADSGHSIVLDGDKAAGNSPMEVVLIALCGCTGYDVVSILQKKREPLSSLEVRAEAERAPDPPSIYTSIKLIYRIGGKVSRKAAEDAVRLSKEKYCSVSAMLAKSAKITTTIEHVDA